MKKLIALAVLVAVVYGINTKAYQAGLDDGFQKGYSMGIIEASETSRNHSSSGDYDEGYADGYEDGYEEFDELIIDEMYDVYRSYDIEPHDAAIRVMDYFFNGGGYTSQEMDDAANAVYEFITGMYKLALN